MFSLLSLRTLRTASLTSLAALVLLGAGLALAAPGPISEVTIPPDTPTRVKTDAGWDLRCPVGCKEVDLPYGHGETKTFCDCNGDGAMDDGCQIWLRTDWNNEQNTVCKPGCPVQGEMCTKITKKFPNGARQQHCECDSPNCAGIVDETDEEEIDEDREEEREEDDEQLFDER